MLPPVPRSPVRAGMIAPAMPERDFEDCPDGPACPLACLLVGSNLHDPAVTKGGISTHWFGCTCLGCSREAYGDFVSRRLNADKSSIAHFVDLSTSDIHDFKDYLLRRAFREDFLPKLFPEYSPGAAPGPVSYSARKEGRP